MTKDKQHIIYLAKCTLLDKGKNKYVGQAQDLEERIVTHKKNGLKASPGAFDDIFIRMGTDNWDFDILKYCDSKQEAIEYEKKYIKKLRAIGIDLLNRTHISKEKTQSSEISNKEKSIKISLSRKSARTRKLLIESGLIKPVINLNTGEKWDTLNVAGENQPYHRVTISNYAKNGKTSPRPNYYRYAFLDSEDIPILTDNHHKEFYRTKRVKCRNTNEIYESAKICADAKLLKEGMIRSICEDSREQSAGPNRLSFCYLDNSNEEILYDSHHKYDKRLEIESKTEFGMFHTLHVDGFNKPDQIFKNKKEIMDKLSPPLKQSDYGHIDDVCQGKRTNVGEFRFFYIIDGEKQITDMHKQKPNKVIYRIRCIDDKKIYKNATSAAKAYDLTAGQISNVCRGNIRTTGGKQFETIDWLNRSITIQKQLKNKKYLLFPDGKTFKSIDELTQATGLSKNRISKYLNGKTNNLGDYKIEKL